MERPGRVCCVSWIHRCFYQTQLQTVTVVVSLSPDSPKRIKQHHVLNASVCPAIRRPDEHLSRLTAASPGWTGRPPVTPSYRFRGAQRGRLTRPPLPSSVRGLTAAVGSHLDLREAAH